MHIVPESSAVEGQGQISDQGTKVENKTNLGRFGNRLAKDFNLRRKISRKDEEEGGIEYL
jgi:hypothetical protein